MAIINLTKLARAETKIRAEAVGRTHEQGKTITRPIGYGQFSSTSDLVFLLTM